MKRLWPPDFPLVQTHHFWEGVPGVPSKGQGRHGRGGGQGEPEEPLGLHAVGGVPR